MDYFQARYYSSVHGRFSSADPIYTTLERLIDPQRLNLYSYVRNNPLRFTDSSGLDIMLNEKTEDEAKRRYQIFLGGLKKEDRQYVHLKVGDGQDGYKKGKFYVVVDKEAKSTSGNFRALQDIANDRTQLTVVTFMKQSETFTVERGVVKGGKVVLEKATEHLGLEKLEPDNPDDVGSETYGYTLLRRMGPPVEGGEYSQSGNNEANIWSEQKDVDMAAYLYHELRAHVWLSNMGRDPQALGHRDPQVKKEFRAAEKEARENFNQQ